MTVHPDQYGIRTIVNVFDVPIKFEIIREVRIGLDTSGGDDNVCGVPTLTVVDMAASKLLANSDRCMQVMSVSLPRAVVWTNIRKLKRVIS
ncbi:hypothetical protein PS2015_1736 [Pseudohongiella spirulinae]|uniref:Uncharacterized protein n=1 Tax=Pseudohongiella spirulinae TaxID=1249552 RepID=A0A0S2KE44_9GAMM|nr:hypothetical protein PS2015_1736 [Pseudohongiella spirulinae]